MNGDGQHSYYNAVIVSASGVCRRTNDSLIICYRSDPNVRADDRVDVARRLALLKPKLEMSGDFIDYIVPGSSKGRLTRVTLLPALRERGGLRNLLARLAAHSAE